MDAILEILKEFGVGGLLAAGGIIGIVAVWRSSLAREKALGKRLDTLNEKLVDLLTQTISDNTAQLVESNKISADILDALRARPCLIETQQLPIVTNIPPGKQHRTPLPQRYPSKS